MPFEQSVIMAEEFARVGVEHEFLQYRGIGHGLSSETNDDAVAKPFEPLTPHLLLNTTAVSSSYVLLSDSGKALVIGLRSRNRLQRGRLRPVGPPSLAVQC